MDMARRSPAAPVPAQEGAAEKGPLASFLAGEISIAELQPPSYSHVPSHRDRDRDGRPMLGSGAVGLAPGHPGRQGHQGLFPHPAYDAEAGQKDDADAADLPAHLHLPTVPRAFLQEQQMRGALLEEVCRAVV